MSLNRSKSPTITLKDGNRITLEKTSFNGDIQKAIDFIQHFCDQKQNSVEIKSWGYGYAELIVNNTPHEITPYGIDLSTMVEYCEGKLADFIFTPVSQNKSTTLKGSTQFNDPSFPDLTIGQFASMQLNIPEDSIVDILHKALPAEKQNITNRELLEKAINFKVNASGAIILMVNTNKGLQLVYGNSQRRQKVVSSNGACEEKESMADTAAREFSEETGNPEQKGILNGIVSNVKNCRSLEVTNKIGKTAEDIANRIIEQLANKNKLYINMSALYVNDLPVNIRALTQEIEVLNIKLKKSAPYYNQAVSLIYGDKNAGIHAAHFDDTLSKETACEVINGFRENCQSNITRGFSRIFSLKFDEETEGSAIKEALSAIIDLTENNEIGLISKAELELLLSLDLSKEDVREKLKKDFFLPSIENIFAHKGKKSPNAFLATLENLSSSVNKTGFGTFNNSNSTNPPSADPKDAVTLNMGRR